MLTGLVKETTETMIEYTGAKYQNLKVFETDSFQSYKMRSFFVILRFSHKNLSIYGKSFQGLHSIIFLLSFNAIVNYILLPSDNTI